MESGRIMRFWLAMLGLALASCSQPSGPTAERSQEVVAWVAEYKGWACGDFTPQLMPVGGFDSTVDLSDVELGLIFYVPPGLTAPDQLEEVGVPGNRFLIRGHFYYHQRSGRKLVVPRFDLLGWEPEPPFERWEEGGSRTLVENPRQKYSRFEGFSSSERASFKVAVKYAGC